MISTVYVIFQFTHNRLFASPARRLFASNAAGEANAAFFAPAVKWLGWLAAFRKKLV